MKKEIEAKALQEYPDAEMKQGEFGVDLSNGIRSVFIKGAEWMQKALEERPSDFYCGEEEDGIEIKCKTQCNSCVTPSAKQLEERPDFLTFVNNTGLSDADKNLIKGVYYDWLPNPKENA